MSKYVQNLSGLVANNESIIAFFKTLSSNVSTASWIGISILCAQFLILPSVVAQYLFISLKIYIIVSIGLLIFKVVEVIVDSLDALSIRYSSPDNPLRFYEKLRYLIPFLKGCLEYIVYFIVATLIIQQIDFISEWVSIGPIGITLITIALLTRILIPVINLLVEEIFLPENLEESKQQGRKTIVPLIQSILRYFVYFGAGVLMLGTVGFDPTPILASAGILGFTIGFGAQNLVNDIVSGFFIFFENYYLVGDYIETDQASGYVESIELRTTRIRHPHGQVYLLRNGDITSVVNYSKGFVYAAVNVGVDYDTDLDQAYEIIEKVGRQFQENNDDILEPTLVEGIQEFDDMRLSIYTKTKVKPGKHLQVERALRKLFKQAFDRTGIHIPVAEMSAKPEWIAQLQQERHDKIEEIQKNSIKAEAEMDSQITNPYDHRC